MSTSQFVEAAQRADVKTKYSVYGYIHEMEIKLQLQFIPDSISIMCLGYYYVQETFYMARSDCFEIEQNGLKITNKKYVRFPDHTIYLNKWIYTKSTLIAKWIFEIIEISSEYYEISFALISNEGDIKQGIQRDGLFGIIFDNGIREYPDRLPQTGTSIDFNHKKSFGKGDIISIIFDLINKTLSYQINESDTFLIHNHQYFELKNKYKMAMQLKSNSVKLLKSPLSDDHTNSS